MRDMARISTADMARFNPAPFDLTVTQDWIDVTSEHPTLDERWRATDSNGHEHFYDRGLPTLNLIIDASHWCAGSEGWMSHDPHEHVDESHYECSECGEVIEPGTVPGGTPRSIPGQRVVTLRGVRSDGCTITRPLTDAEVDAVQADGSEGVRLIESAEADGRVIQITFTS